MPRIQIIDPLGVTYTICTRQTETILLAWFDEVLPHTYVTGRPDIDDFKVLWPKINIHPMWAWKPGELSDPDWICDSRAICQIYEFPAKDGETACKCLIGLRSELEFWLRDGANPRTIPQRAQF